MSAALGMLWLTQITPTTTYVDSVLPAMVLISLGMGFVFVPLAATALFGIGEHDAGVGSAVLNSMQQIGGSLGAALLNTIAATATASYLVVNHSPSQVQDGLVHGYTTAFWVGAAFLAAAAACRGLHHHRDEALARAARRRRPGRLTRKSHGAPRCRPTAGHSHVRGRRRTTDCVHGPPLGRRGDRLPGP